MFPVPTTLPIFFGRRCFSVKMSRTTVLSPEVLILLFSTPHHRCSDAHVAWDPLGFHWSYADNLGGSWLAAQTALTFISHASLQVHRKPTSMFTTSLPSGSADVPGYEASPADTYSLSPTYGLFAPSHWRSGHGARQRSAFFGAHQSWCSLNP